MHVSLEFGTMARLDTRGRADFEPEQLIDALKVQLEAGRLLWPKLAKVKIVDERIVADDPKQET